MTLAKQILEKHRKKDASLPHWITMKHAELAMDEYPSKLLSSKEKHIKNELTYLVNQFTGSSEELGHERHSQILVERLYKMIKTQLSETTK